ncbi:MAG: retroviral-like aspartic protease family protein [Vicinamibacterales bacterium]
MEELHRGERRLFPAGLNPLRAALIAALVLAATFVLRADTGADAELQYQVGTLLFEQSRYREAAEAFDRAAQAGDAALATRARKGKVRAALRIAEFAAARETAELLYARPDVDAEGISLYGDALWASGRFDDADAAYQRASQRTPESPRALFGRARSLGTISKLDEALDMALAASAAAPRDGEIHALLGELYERMYRYDDAAAALRSYINLLPNKDRSDKAAWARAQVEFLDSFKGVRPVEIDAEDRAVLHTLPFRIVNDKVIVRARINGSNAQDFVLDTGSEETIISADSARRHRVRPVTYTLSAGVGEIGVRGLQLARIQSLDLGTLQVRNVPVLVKSPALRGMPRPESESFSPLAIGLSMTIDYGQRLLTIGSKLPPFEADHRLPMRIHRLAMVRGLLNDRHPAYFVVDTGGEVISISSDIAQQLPPSQYRRIPLRVWGTSGWDRDAFLLPGVDLEFDRIEYRNHPLVVLNLRAPSLLLGFQLGGIVGHKFLAPYRVAIDLVQSELRLQKQ